MQEGRLKGSVCSLPPSKPVGLQFDLKESKRDKLVSFQFLNCFVCFLLSHRTWIVSMGPKYWPNSKSVLKDMYTWTRSRGYVKPGSACADICPLPVAALIVQEGQAKCGHVNHPRSHRHQWWAGFTPCVLAPEPAKTPPSTATHKPMLKNQQIHWQIYVIKVDDFSSGRNIEFLISTQKDTWSPTGY